VVVALAAIGEIPGAGKIDADRLEAAAGHGLPPGRVLRRAYIRALLNSPCHFRPVECRRWGGTDLADFRCLLPGITGLSLLSSPAAMAAAAEADDDDNQPAFPTTECAEGASSASVTVGDITATVRTDRKAKQDPAGDLIRLQVTLGGRTVAEASGPDAGFD